MQSDLISEIRHGDRYRLKRVHTTSDIEIAFRKLKLAREKRLAWKTFSALG